MNWRHSHRIMYVHNILCSHEVIFRSSLLSVYFYSVLNCECSRLLSASESFCVQFLAERKASHSPFSSSWLLLWIRWGWGETCLDAHNAVLTHETRLWLRGHKGCSPIDEARFTACLFSSLAVAVPRELFSQFSEIDCCSQFWQNILCSMNCFNTSLKTLTRFLIL